ncbi:response regulator receiver modulated diguanylate cyclase/phosphodiesterase with PAS/PAC sensor(s) [[Leptolyngbya] sp. PCC 7376]|uniref:two-component system response regulator n=1 Tax=[Leptolyngbya] sp. PCC 7376 TaxID=111781 RepID=UPI00029EE752|nr:EAL domain-containing protein [[Leptolyngbya] sp. PCC 7376]AFY40182.1 response regulator receiver modulated diguanylate cyclase/phosphodiesterase with PAS/PAC sensor(s) [[Leptolyngbya] sp. PCC 7376]
MSADLFDGKTPEILIADDTLESLAVLTETISSHGYDVRSVSKGFLAYESALAAQPDLILLDIRMPALSGYEVCKKLKEHPATQDIPIIFISALNEGFDKVQAFAVGGVDYITKPFQTEEVLVRIQSHVALHFSRLQIQDLNSELEQRVQARSIELLESNRQLQNEIIEKESIAQSLRESESKFRQISECIDEVFWLTNYDSRTRCFTNVEYVSPAFEKVWGKETQVLYDNHFEWTNAIHIDDRQRVIHAFSDEAIKGAFEEEYRVVTPDGGVRWIYDRGFPIHDKAGEVYRVAGIAQDITERKVAELERDRVFKLSLDLLFVANDQGELERVNPAWTKLLGYSSQELQNQSFWDFIHPDDLDLVEQDSLQLLSNGKEIDSLELRCRRKDNSYIWTAWNIVPFLRENRLYGAGRNIAQRKASEARFVHEILHDALTGLSNRVHVMQQIKQAIKKERRHPDHHFAVLFIDLDNFKQINDTLGHLIGDKLLIKIAKILEKSVREIDSVARLGGDEFLILLEDFYVLQDVLRVVERIQDHLKTSFMLESHEVFSSASIGIVIGTPDYQSVSDIIRDADIAMYRAKAEQKGSYAIFDQEMYAETLHEVELENALRQAITNNEFRIYFQPIVNLKNASSLEGFEILLRWLHPEKGWIPPSEFIPIAEDIGLINSIDQWVFHQACVEFQRLTASYKDFERLYFSINISGRHLKDPSLISSLESTLKTTKVPCDCLKLELTESSLIDNTNTAVEILSLLQNKGLRISLDDFGTGFSSLRYLHQFPIDVIKIDRSFILSLDKGDREQSIIHAIITLAKALGFKTVAEGIETNAQLMKIKSLGCDSGQGYLFSRPMSKYKLIDFLSQHGFLRQNSSVAIAHYDDRQSA